jgi:hypothetical protein
MDEKEYAAMEAAARSGSPETEAAIARLKAEGMTGLADGLETARFLFTLEIELALCAGKLVNMAMGRSRMVASELDALNRKIDSLLDQADDTVAEQFRLYCAGQFPALMEKLAELAHSRDSEVARAAQR